VYTYCTFELINPNYIPIEVNQFSYLEFEIRDLHGYRSKFLQVIPFDVGAYTYCTFELINPNYIPIQVNQFSYLEFEIKDFIPKTDCRSDLWSCPYNCVTASPFD